MPLLGFRLWFIDPGKQGQSMVHGRKSPLRLFMVCRGGAPAHYIHNAMSASHTVGLKDCDVSYFSGAGAGGQHRNKHQNCVRLYHAPSNARITAQDHREKRANEIDALTRLSKHPSFRFWASEELKRLEGRQTIAQAIEEQLRPEHLEYTTF